MIKQYVNMNLLEAFASNELDGIIHGCNCFHAMASGIAPQIANQYAPIVRDADKKTEFGDWSKLGDYSLAETVNGLIINAYTQYRPGRCPADQLYSNIRRVFAKLNMDFPNMAFGIPKIGSGIAGGDWDTIAQIIHETTPDLYIYVYYI